MTSSYHCIRKGGWCTWLTSFDISTVKVTKNPDANASGFFHVRFCIRHVRFSMECSIYWLDLAVLSVLWKMAIS